MKRAKTNVNHIEQARADITFNGKKAIMTLDWDKPSRFYIHVRGMGVNKVIAEQQDPRAILMDWTRSMKKYGGELVARTPKQQELIQKQHQLAASFRDSRSRFFSPEFLRELRKAYLKDIRYGKKMTPKNLLAGSGVQAMGEPMKIGNEKELQQALANAKWPKPRRMFTPRTMDQEWTDRGTLVATKTTVYARKGSKKVVSESIMVNEDYLGKGPKESQGASGDKSSATRQAANPQELKEMESILKKYGYDPKDAKKLQQEGIGPEELKNRARIPGKGVGTLEYTHNLKRKGNATQQWASMRDAKDSGYKTYFDKKLKEWGIKSPADLDDAKKKKFFADVDQGWKSKDEKKK